MKTLAISLALSLSLCIAAIANAADKPTVVAKKDLPALKGGAEKAERKTPDDGIPQCFNGSRAKLSSSDDVVKTWAADHEKHACAGAATVYVCRAGRNLSVRCE